MMNQYVREMLLDKGVDLLSLLDRRDLINYGLGLFGHYTSSLLKNTCLISSPTYFLSLSTSTVVSVGTLQSGIA
jgi:hypothetical protein